MRIQMYLGAWEFQAIPTLMIFHQGKMIERLVGPRPSDLKGTIDRVLSQHGISIA